MKDDKNRDIGDEIEVCNRNLDVVLRKVTRGREDGTIHFRREVYW